MGEVKSARQKVEEEKLRAEAQNAPGLHRKTQPDDCDGCDEKKKARQEKAQKAKTEAKDD